MPVLNIWIITVYHVCAYVYVPLVLSPNGGNYCTDGNGIISTSTTWFTDILRIASIYHYEVKETDLVRAQSLELELQVKQQLPNISKLLNHLLTNDESPIF